ncbi:MAG: LysR family transcriptional regulator, partial [Sphingomonadales bacterium]
MLNSADIGFLNTIAAKPSLAEVARSLNVTPSAVSQRLRELERRLDLKLVERSSRRLGLTDEGELILKRGLPAIEAIEDLWDELSARRQVVAGHLRILAPIAFGRRHVAEVAGRFQALNPELKLDLILSDQPNRENMSQVDMTVHIGEQVDSSLLMSTLAPNRRILCASPEFLKQYGAPTHPDQLGRFNNIVIRENREDVTLYSFRKPGEEALVRIEPSLVCNEGEVARQWALDGLGLLVRSEWHITGDLKAGRLIEVLPGYKLPDANVVALFGFRHGRAFRTRAFFESLRKSLTPTP